MKEIVYFGTYEDPKDANREKVDKIKIYLKRSFKTTGSFKSVPGILKTRPEAFLASRL